MAKRRTDAEILRERAKARKKKERFITIRMWVSFISSKLFRDRGTIPANIGNNVFIGNNQMITKNSMTVVFAVTSFSDFTPVGFVGEVTQSLKKYAKNVKVDVTIKTSPYKFDSSDRGLASRVTHWKRVMNSPAMDASAKEKAARLVYSTEVLSSGERGFSTIVYILLRSNNGRDLDLAVKECKAALSQYKLGYREIRDDLRYHLDNLLLISNKADEKLKDFPTTLFTSRTIAELLPVTQGMNDKQGVMFGFDNMNNSPYYIDLKRYSEGKTLLIIGQSGKGKTFLTLYITYDAHNSEHFNACITDLKGNEFTGLTKSLGGIILSMKESNPYYINPYVLPSFIAPGKDPMEVYASKLSLGKEYLKIIINPLPDEEAATETLVNDFMSEMYKKAGVTPTNINSWSRSKAITPYKVAEDFFLFMGASQRERFGSLGIKAIDRVRLYMDRSAPLSHIWRKELVLDDILDSSCITFDYGMLDAEKSYDETIFKLKFAQADYIKDVYIAHKKSKGEWTWLVDEEAQLAQSYVAKAYKKDVTMRRSQNCVTCVLCNSVTSLLAEPEFKAVLGNIKIQIIGNITKSDREFMVREYDLQEYERVLEVIVEDPAYYRSFLLVNGLQPTAPTPLLQVYVPDDVAKSSLYATVDVKEVKKK